MAALADRVRAMIAQPAQEWPVIAAESGSITDVLRGYVVPLALIGPVLSLAGAVIFSHEPVLVAMTAAVLEFILEIVAVFVVAFIAAAVAPSFGGTADRLAAFKWVAYSSTARFVAGIFLVLPVFGRLIVLVASLYSLYTLYLGTVPVMRVATEKAAGFTIVVVLVYIVAIAIVTFLVTALLALFFASAAIATGGFAR